jgi:hypothetical protein
MRPVGTCALALLALASLAFPSAPAQAQTGERVTLGFGRLFTNDFFGDGRDRWHSGGYTFSLLRGAEGQVGRPDRLGSTLEYRLRSEIITPGTEDPVTGVDRPYAGTISLGLHSHAALGRTDVSLGADVMLMGPSTGISGFQEWYHDLFSLPDPPGRDSELGNAVHAGLTGELAWPLRITDTATLRPFVELQAGIEDIARVGGDVILGRVGHDDLLTREVTTGSLIRAVEGPYSGWILIAGADWAQVGDSVLLPADQGFAPTDSRWRARVGVHWQAAPKMSFHYGLTWLSEEFEGQPEGQLIGGLKLNFNF